MTLIVGSSIAYPWKSRDDTSMCSTTSAVSTLIASRGEKQDEQYQSSLSKIRACSKKGPKSELGCVSFYSLQKATLKKKVKQSKIDCKEAVRYAKVV